MRSCSTSPLLTPEKFWQQQIEVINLEVCQNFQGLVLQVQNRNIRQKVTQQKMEKPLSRENPPCALGRPIGHHNPVPVQT